jgi:predicted NAD-dependent protein-ADP-ribosyltransferase YbiA (DUF1768 family)
VIGDEKVDGAQLIKKTWVIYAKDAQSRAELLTSGVNIRGKYARLYYEFPGTIKNSEEHTQTEKITLHDVPWRVSNAELANIIQSYPGVTLKSALKFRNARSPNGEWMPFKNGDRFCYAKGPIQPPLPKIFKIGNVPCRIYHKSPRSQVKYCKVCKNNGHSALQYNQHSYTSVEQGFQHTKAIALERQDIAKKIMKTSTGSQAKKAAEDLNEEDECWNIIKAEVMNELIKAKIKCCEEFKNALIESGDKVLAEATSNI